MCEIKIGQIYKHFKGKLYVVLDIINNVKQKYRFEEVSEVYDK